MKYLVLTIIFLVSGFASFSQLNPMALGVRLGGGNLNNNAEISFHKGLGDANRIEVDLGLFSGRNISGFGLFGGYHWNWNIIDDLNWFAGPGASISAVNNKNGNDYTGIGVGGQVGIEYNFAEKNAPLLLGLDLRPLWNLVGDSRSALGVGGALSLRYIF